MNKKNLQTLFILKQKKKILIKKPLKTNFFHILQNYSHILPNLLFINVTYYVQNECETKFNRFFLFFLF